MDENKGKTPQKSADHVIDLSAARKAREKEERAEEKRLAREERPAFWKRALSLVLIVALVLSTLVLTVYWDQINFDGIRRTISYFGTAQDETGQTEPFAYDRGTDNSFMPLGKSLAHVTQKGVALYDQKGRKHYQKDMQMEYPALEVGASAAVAYDIGGNSLVVFSEHGELLDLKTEEGGAIYSASLNKSDWLAVTARKKGQKGCVTVYNAEMERVFEFDSASRYVVDAYVTEDCKYLIAVTLGQEDGAFESQMAVYRLDREEKYAEFTMRDTLVLSVSSIGGQTLCVGDKALAIAGNSGEIKSTYQYDMPYLREFSDRGDGFVVLALNQHRAGTEGKLVTVAADGTVIAERSLSEEVLDISAAGRYIAVLYTDRLAIYNKDLTEYGCFTETKTASQAQIRSDGSVWLIADDTIGLLIP